MELKQLTDLGIPEEQAKQALDLHTAELEAEQGKVTDLTAQLETAQKNIGELTEQVKKFDGEDIDSLGDCQRQRNGTLGHTVCKKKLLREPRQRKRRHSQRRLARKAVVRAHEARPSARNSERSETHLWSEIACLKR